MPTSSYFQVKNIAAFLEWVDSIPGLTARQARPPRRKTFAHATTPPADSWQLHWPGNEWILSRPHDTGPLNLYEELQPHLMPHAVVVLKETYQVGSKLCGRALAFHASGETVAVELDHIYSLARERFNSPAVWPEEEYG